MHGVDLDPAHLRSFLAIVRYGGYHRAADALHLTQPAVSRHIRRLEEQLGEPLFAKRGRGVELTAYGERAAAELGDVLDAHDGAVARLQRGGGTAAVRARHDREPRRPGAARPDRRGARAARRAADAAAGRPLVALVDRVARGEVDAAILVDAGDAQKPLELGSIPLHWWAAPALAAAPVPDPLPLVAYDPPCGLRDLALRPAGRARASAYVHHRREPAPERRPHGRAQRARLRACWPPAPTGSAPCPDGPLAGTIPARLWLVLTPAERALAAPLRAALWRATTRRTLPAAA